MQRRLPICKLCDENLANQTGAHIFPAWLISSAFDEDNNNRDYEIIYDVSLIDNKQPYFGRSVNLDRIKKEIGRDLTDEDIKNQKNELVVDNLWCRSCERKFKILEDFFLEISRRLDFSNIDNIGIKKLGEEKYLIRLFFYSLIYRATISDLNGKKIKNTTEKKLANWINKYLKSSIKETSDYISNSSEKEELLKYPLVLFKIDNSRDRTNNFVLIHNKHDKPYCYVINQFAFEFYEKESHRRSTPISFFGINDKLNEMDNHINYKEVDIKFTMISHEVWNSIRDNVVNHFSNLRKQNIIILFKAMYNQKFKQFPSDLMVDKFWRHLVEDEVPIGSRYTRKNIVKAMNNTLK